MNPLQGSRDAETLIQQWLEFYNSRWLSARFDLITIRFIQMRQIDGYQVRSVALQDKAGQKWRFRFLLIQVEGLWFVKTSSGGIEEEILELPQFQGVPRIDLEALYMGDDFYAFGTVFEQGYRISLVRLLDSNGLVLEDTVQNQIVFFYTQQQPVYPLRLDLYDDVGKLIH
jgi:hypothetical protein